MKRIMLALLLLCAFQAPASELITNIQGKTLDQFFIMASDVMGKTIVTFPSIDGDVKIYNIGRAANFRDVFFYVIRANGLAYQENKDKIEVNVYQELSRVDGTVKASDIVTSNRSLQTTLDIRPGTTIMIGGAVSEEKSNMVQKVPVLGDIPLIGALFRSKNDTETTRDLKILLSVQLIRS